MASAGRLGESGRAATFLNRLHSQIAPFGPASVKSQQDRQRLTADQASSTAASASEERSKRCRWLHRAGTPAVDQAIERAKCQTCHLTAAVRWTPLYGRIRLTPGERVQAAGGGDACNGRFSLVTCS